MSSTATERRPHVWGWTVGLVAVATFMLILDLTVVNVALLDMQRSFHTKVTELEWVVNTYALMLGALLLISGSTADRVGRRLIFVVGMVIFTTGSLLSAVSPSVILLILFRGFQGIGGAMLFATALGILGNLFEGGERTRALAVWGTAVGGGLAVGPLVGGLLTQLFGWPAIFLVNVPIGVGVILLTLFRMPESKDPNPRRTDYLGALSLALALIALIYALVQGNQMGWDNPEILAAFALAALLGVAFVLVERAPEPMADLRLLFDSRFRAASLGVFGQGLVIGAMLFYLLRFLQEGLGDNPLVAGLEVLPMTVSAMSAAVLGSRLAVRFRAEWMMVGSLALMVGGALLMLMVSLSGGWLWLLPGLLVAGFGWGAINPASAHAALAAANDEQSGMASGFVNSARQVGIAVGLGGLGAIFELQVRLSTLGGLRGLTSGLGRRIAVIAAQSGLAPALAASPKAHRPEVAEVVRQALLSGLRGVLIASAVGAALTCLLILALARGRSGRDAG